MRLKLQYLSRSRLLTEVVVSGGEAVFVPTAEVLQPGTPVQLELDVPKLEAPILVNAVVKQVRPLAGSSPAGLLVKLDAASVEKCKALVAHHDDAARIAGRSEVRVDCDLSARVLSPVAMHGCFAKSLSRHGLTLKTPQPLVKDAQLTLALTLTDGTDALLAAQVMWTRPELSLAGLKLLGLDETTSKRLDIALEALGQRVVPASVRSRLVVIADDDASILDFTSRVITKAGHRVMRAERGDLALELIRKEKPDLVLIDVLMPGLDGLEVCKAIRADAALQHLQVVMLSAMAESKIAQAAASCGADGYMVKPMQLEAVRAMLDERLK
jgi:CheY-like chemotaxis protein